MSNYKFETSVVHAGEDPDPYTGAVIPPIYLTSTYSQSLPGIHKGYEYSRVSNPTRDILEKKLAVLEEGRFAKVFASGMSAISALAFTLKSGDRIVVSRTVYGGTYRFFSHLMVKMGIEVDYADVTYLEQVEKKLGDNTRFLFIETPANPSMEISDIKMLSKLAKSRGVKLVVDNTFLSPYLQQPLKLGADVVIHSTTKYINGHSDSLGGVVVTNDKQLAEELAFVQKTQGAVLSPFEAFLILRGVKTLAIRMEKQQQNAQKIAVYLYNHPKVEKVLYPGLETHPGFEIHKKQARGPGAMISFDLGNYENVKKFLSSLSIITLAESLGGIETLISHPFTMTHASMDENLKRELGITEGLLRISVGIENVNDLLDELDRALSRV